MIIKETKEELEQAIHQYLGELEELSDLADRKRRLLNGARARLKVLNLGWEKEETVLYAPNVAGEVPLLFKEIMGRLERNGEYEQYIMSVVLNPDGSNGGLVIPFPIAAAEQIRTFRNLDAYYEQFPPITPPEDVKKEETSSANEDALNAIEIIYPDTNTNEMETNDGTTQHSGKRSSETNQEAAEGAQSHEEGNESAQEASESNGHQA